MERLGLGRVVADANDYFRMEGAMSDGTRRQERVVHRRFQIVSIGDDSHRSLLVQSGKGQTTLIAVARQRFEADQIWRKNVSVSEGGNAIVGNVTQHASVVVKEKGAASAGRKAAKGAGSGRRCDTADTKREGEA
jgi:hypothetical protein